MKKSIKQYVVAVVLGLGIVLGVGSLQAQWTAPSATPPGGNVPAPLNTGNSSQSKLGQLIVNTNTTSNGPGPFAVGLSVFGKTILNGGIQIPTTDGANKVLTSDATGNASWQTPTGAGSFSRVLLDAPTVLYNPGGEVAYYEYYTAPLGPNVVSTSVQSGTIQAGTTAGIPVNAKSVLLYGMWDCNTCLTEYIRFKHPSQTNWKRLVFINDAAYGSDNSTWLPLDSSGRLQWEVSADGAATGIRLEIQGYEIY